MRALLYTSSMSLVTAALQKPACAYNSDGRLQRAGHPCEILYQTKTASRSMIQSWTGSKGVEESAPRALWDLAIMPTNICKTPLQHILHPPQRSGKPTQSLSR